MSLDFQPANVGLVEQTPNSNIIEQKPAKLYRPRFGGSGKHLNIKTSDDFDEPLEDFAEYM